jgi:transposase
VLFEEVGAILEERGLLMRQGTIVDATIIAAPPSTKNKQTDAEAIAEAASRPTMRFVAVKTEGQQARAMLFRTRDLLVRQRTQLIRDPMGRWRAVDAA